MRARAARSRELIAKGRRPAVVARVLQVNRSGLYRTPKRPPKTTRRAVVDPVDRLIVKLARDNPTDGTRMVGACEPAARTGAGANVSPSKPGVIDLTRDSIPTTTTPACTLAAHWLATTHGVVADLVTAQAGSDLVTINAGGDRAQQIAASTSSPTSVASCSPTSSMFRGHGIASSERGSPR